MNYKKLSLLFLASLILPVSAEDAPALPDLSKVFTDTKVMSKQQTYSFFSKHSFDALKKQFLESLGEGWAEEVMDEAIKKESEEMLKKMDVDVKMPQMITIKNPKFPGIQIQILKIDMETFAKKDETMIAVTIMETNMDSLKE